MIDDITYYRSVGRQSAGGLLGDFVVGTGPRWDGVVERSTGRGGGGDRDAGRTRAAGASLAPPPVDRVDRRAEGADRHRRRRPKRIERGRERGGRGLLLITSADRLRCVINPRRRATALCVNLPSRVGIIRLLQLRRSRARRQYTFFLDQVRRFHRFPQKKKKKIEITVAQYYTQVLQ